MTQHVIYPGTFDPITLGHINIIKRALTLFDKVTIAIANSTSKRPMFDIDQRVELVQRAVHDYKNITVKAFDSLLVEFAKQQKCNIILRGIRGVDDLEYEKQLALMNKKLAKNIETVFILPDIEFQHISSSLVKDIALHQGDVSKFVPKNVCAALKITSGNA